jgi:type I restriction-modification system DNA methylase subunit
VSEIAIEQCGFYLPDHARYDYLLNLPEEKDIAKALKEAMKAIEEYKPELEGRAAEGRIRGADAHRQNHPASNC